jgi:hypothetical protein
MRTDTDRLVGALLHGWVELLTLFAMLLVALLLMGWSWNRGLRPADRGPAVGWAPLLLGFGLVLLLRHLGDQLWHASIIAAGLVIGGFLARVSRPSGLWLPTMVLAALMGLGLHLSAVLFTLFTLLVLLFSADRGR